MSVLSRALRRVLLVVALVALLALPAAPAAATHAAVQPGAPMRSSVGGCTLNFIFDGSGSLSGRVFVGTAAHCVRNPGDRITINGHASAGTVFYVGDVPNAVNGDGRGDNGYAGHQLDFALVEVTGTSAPVVATVRGHPGMPSGVTTHVGTSTGDLVHLSGHGLGFSLTQQTREMRSGVLGSDFARSYNAYAPAISGDSGGPVLHESGQALGVASTIGANGLAGPTVAGILAELSELGLPVTLRTA